MIVQPPNYLIIAGTNRPQSNTWKVASFYQRLLAEKGINANLLNLTTFQSFQRDEPFLALEQTYLVPTDKFIIVSPEYNGSIPGVLKLMIDLADIKTAWWYKKAMLVGVATGRAGNLRGMDHLTAILNHLKVEVMTNRLPLSSVDRLLSPDGDIEDQSTRNVIGTQIDQFIAY